MGYVINDLMSGIHCFFESGGCPKMVSFSFGVYVTITHQIEGSDKPLWKFLRDFPKPSAQGSILPLRCFQTSNHSFQIANLGPFSFLARDVRSKMIKTNCSLSISFHDLCPRLASSSRFHAPQQWAKHPFATEPGFVGN